MYLLQVRQLYLFCPRPHCVSQHPSWLRRIVLELRLTMIPAWGRRSSLPGFRALSATPDRSRTQGTSSYASTALLTNLVAMYLLRIYVLSFSRSRLSDPSEYQRGEVVRQDRSENDRPKAMLILFQWNWHAPEIVGCF